MTRFIRLWNSPQGGSFDFRCLCKNLLIGFNLIIAINLSWLCTLHHWWKTSWDERHILFVSLIIADTTAANRAYSLTWPASMLIYWNKPFTWEKSSNPTGPVWDTNMAAVSLFWNTNMATVTSCENALYTDSWWRFSHIFHTIGEIGNSRFHA